MRRIATLYPDAVKQISNVEQIIAFRNQLVHNYPGTESKLVWDIIEFDVARLLAEVRALLPSP